MKTEFELEIPNNQPDTKGTALIIGTRPKYRPYLKFDFVAGENRDYLSAYVKDKDLERFAVNILKALKSKHLKS